MATGGEHKIRSDLPRCRTTTKPSRSTVRIASAPEMRGPPGIAALLKPTIRSEMLKAGVIETVQNPYDFNDLLAKIREVIGPEEVADDHPELF